MNNVSIYIKNAEGTYVPLDLFDDETINMNSSIQNIKDISKTYTDFTQQFKIPASPNNNKVFKHWYDRHIQDGFDGRTRSDGFIEINYTPFKTGNIQLDGVDLRDGKPFAYRITFYGLLVNLKDRFKDDYISSLDYSDTLFTYDYDTVKLGLTQELSGSVIFPLISTEEQWYYDETSSAISASANTKNIDYQSGTSKGINWQNLKPAIKVRSIIDRIETKYGITFSDDFFGTEPLDNLYMWASREKGRLQTVGTDEGQKIDWDAPSSVSGFINLTLDSWDNAIWDYDTGGGYNRQIFTLQMTVTPAGGYSGVEWEMEMRNELDDNVVMWSSGVKTGTKTFSTTLSVTNQYYRFVNEFFIIANGGFSYSASVTITRLEYRNGTFYTNESHTFTASTDTISGDITVGQYLPKLKVIDFLNGLIKMFNLVVIPETDTSIYVDKLDNWLLSGSSQDITGRIDNSTITVDRVDVPSLIRFEFEEAGTILAEEYLRTNNLAYGDLEYEAFDSGSQKKIWGSALEVKLPFENMIYERLYKTAGDGDISSIQYGAVIDDDYKPVLMKPHLFYANLIDCSDSTFGLISPGSDNTEMSSSWMPFHGNTPTGSSYSTTWNTDLNEWDLSAMNNNLYSNNWSDYINDLYDITRRKYSLSARLSQGIMGNLADGKTYNKIEFEGSRYIINSYKANLATGEVKFELLNDIYSNNIDVNAPTAPTNLAATNVTTESMDLSWDASTDDVGVVGYYINKNGQFYTGSQFTTKFIDGQVSGSTNTWTVNAYDFAGNISPTSSALVLLQGPLDELPPLSITGLTASYVDATNLTLEWDATTDNPSGTVSGLAGYKVYKGGILQNTTTNTSASFSGLVEGSTSYWVVTAYDNVGNENLGTGFNVTQTTLETPLYEIYLAGPYSECSGDWTTNNDFYYIDRNTSAPDVGDKIYVDDAGTTPLNGGGNWWWWNGGYQAQIDATGSVVDWSFCF